MLFQGKTFRDPVHGNIKLPWPVLIELTDSPEFQRLRNIRQLGMCLSTFHGAEHSRFQHAMGTAWLMYRILTRWEQEGLLHLPLQERQSACAAALLHDIGHGPFSHALERVFSGVNHEILGRLLVQHRLGRVLEKHGLEPEQVLQIMDGTYNLPVITELLASQLDVDRMDYLQRDSLYTGVKYGLFDMERIIHTLIPLTEKATGKTVLAIDPKGMLAVEEFLFSRYFMHWQVYLHRTVRSAEVLLKLILERARRVYEIRPDALHIPPNLHFLFLESEPDQDIFLEHFVQIDDFDIFHSIKQWQYSDDKCLSDLSRRFVSRRLFKVFTHSNPQAVLPAVQPLIEKQFGTDWRFYIRADTPTDYAFGIYRPGEAGSPIRVETRPGCWEEISHIARTDAIAALATEVSQSYLMVAPECRDEVAAILNQL